MRSRFELTEAKVAITLLLAGWLIMYVPTYIWLYGTIWASDEQGHGPIILGVCAYLLYQKRHLIAVIDCAKSTILGASVLGVGCFLYILGRSQSIYILDVGSQLFVLAGLLLLIKGKPGFRVALFPILFLIFMVPLPSTLVAAVTAPLKAAVSSAAASILYALGFPIARSGVSLSIGQYQLLVADACAGLNSMFTLEALGLLYMNIMDYKSLSRNIWLAAVVIPISFCANVTRVIILILITFYFGDEAGQGFAHEFAGLLLFGVALLLILAADSAIGFALRSKRSGVEVAALS